jgi:hypothetical protein
MFFLKIVGWWKNRAFKKAILLQMHSYPDYLIPPNLCNGNVHQKDRKLASIFPVSKKIAYNNFIYITVGSF